MKKKTGDESLQDEAELAAAEYFSRRVASVEIPAYPARLVRDAMRKRGREGAAAFPAAAAAAAVLVFASLSEIPRARDLKPVDRGAALLFMDEGIRLSLADNALRAAETIGKSLRKELP